MSAQSLLEGEPGQATGFSHSRLSYLRPTFFKVAVRSSFLKIYIVSSDLSKIFAGLADRFEAFRPQVLSELAQVLG